MNEIKRSAEQNTAMPPGPDPSISAVEVLEVMLSDPDPAFVVAEIAEELDEEIPTTRKRMKQLVEQGLLIEKKPSPKARIYWESEEGKEYYFDQAKSSDSDVS